MIKLEHGQMVKIRGQYGRVGTALGWARAWKFDEPRTEEFLRRSRERGDLLAWIYRESEPKSDEPDSVKELREKRHASAVELRHGQEIQLEGSPWMVVLYRAGGDTLADLVELGAGSEVEPRVASGAGIR